jgi:hypothetical protein
MIRRLLVARGNEADAGARKRIEEIEILLAANAEDEIDTFVFQTADEQVGGFQNKRIDILTEFSGPLQGGGAITGISTVNIDPPRGKRRSWPCSSGSGQAGGDASGASSPVKRRVGPGARIGERIDPCLPLGGLMAISPA